MGEDVTERDVLEISGFIDTSVVDKWLKTCLSNNFDNTQDFVQNLIAEGYAASQLILQLHDAVLRSEQLEDVKKARILEKMSISDRRLLDGGNEYLQLLDVSCEIMKQAKWLSHSCALTVTSRFIGYFFRFSSCINMCMYVDYLLITIYKGLS